MNVCMVGYGMMGVWHSEALLKTDAVLHTVVGRRSEAAREFAERFGYRKWSLSLDEALADPEVDIVILATPSDQHEEQAVKSLSGWQAYLDRNPDRDELAGCRARG